MSTNWKIPIERPFKKTSTVFWLASPVTLSKRVPVAERTSMMGLPEAAEAVGVEPKSDAGLI